jgi:hypothetical protein
MHATTCTHTHTHAHTHRLMFYKVLLNLHLKCHHHEEIYDYLNGEKEEEKNIRELIL